MLYSKKQELLMGLLFR